MLVCGAVPVPELSRGGRDRTAPGTSQSSLFCGFHLVLRLWYPAFWDFLALYSPRYSWIYSFFCSYPPTLLSFYSSWEPSPGRKHWVLHWGVHRGPSASLQPCTLSSQSGPGSLPGNAGLLFWSSTGPQFASCPISLPFSCRHYCNRSCGYQWFFHLLVPWGSQAYLVTRCGRKCYLWGTGYMIWFCYSSRLKNYAATTSILPEYSTHKMLTSQGYTPTLYQSGSGVESQTHKYCWAINNTLAVSEWLSGDWNKN